MRKLWLCLMMIACGEPAGRPNMNVADCTDARVLARLPAELSEVSGLAVSARTPGVFWTHNDDGTVIFAIDSTGAIRARVRVPDRARGHDWEDISAAPCAEGACLFIGDIGDNRQDRKTRSVLRFPEPALTDTVTATPVRERFVMPDKSHDAEALAVTRDGRMFVITKGRSGPVTAFVFPTTRADVNTLIPVAQLSAGLVQLPDMVTGAAAVPGTDLIAVRTYGGLQFYRVAGDQLAPVYDAPFDLRFLQEAQGEGIAVRGDGVVFLVSERGMAEAATLARVACRLPD